MSYINVRYIGNYRNQSELYFLKLLIKFVFIFHLQSYIPVTLLIVLLTPLDILDKGVLLIMSGRQGAGGFIITCNEIMEDESY